MDVIVGDLNKDRLEQARSFGCETVDVSLQASLADQIDPTCTTSRLTLEDTVEFFNLILGTNLTPAFLRAL